MFFNRINDVTYLDSLYRKRCTKNEKSACNITFNVVSIFASLLFYLHIDNHTLLQYSITNIVKGNYKRKIKKRNTASVIRMTTEKSTSMFSYVA